MGQSCSDGDHTAPRGMKVVPGPVQAKDDAEGRQRGLEAEDDGNIPESSRRALNDFADALKAAYGHPLREPLDIPPGTLLVPVGTQPPAGTAAADRGRSLKRVGSTTTGGSGGANKHLPLYHTRKSLPPVTIRSATPPGRGASVGGPFLGGSNQFADPYAQPQAGLRILQPPRSASAGRPPLPRSGPANSRQTTPLSDLGNSGSFGNRPSTYYSTTSDNGHQQAPNHFQRTGPPGVGSTGMGRSTSSAEPFSHDDVGNKLLTSPVLLRAHTLSLEEGNERRVIETEQRRGLRRIQEQLDDTLNQDQFQLEMRRMWNALKEASASPDRRVQAGRQPFDHESSAYGGRDRDDYSHYNQQHHRDGHSSYVSPPSDRPKPPNRRPPSSPEFQRSSSSAPYIADTFAYTSSRYASTQTKPPPPTTSPTRDHTRSNGRPSTNVERTVLEPFNDEELSPARRQVLRLHAEKRHMMQDEETSERQTLEHMESLGRSAMVTKLSSACEELALKARMTQQRALMEESRQRYKDRGGSSLPTGYDQSSDDRTGGGYSSATSNGKRHPKRSAPKLYESNNDPYGASSTTPNSSTMWYDRTNQSTVGGGGARTPNASSRALRDESLSATNSRLMALATL